MKTKNFRIITYGDAFSEWPSTSLREWSRGVPLRKTWSRLEDPTEEMGEYLLVSSDELDDEFAEVFREKATQATRLLVLLNEGASADRLLSRIVDLQIRTPQRFYVVDASVGSGKTPSAALVHSLLKRLASALEADDKQERILDAKVEDGVLHVVSQNFSRLDVPIAMISSLRKADSSKIEKFEIDKDGSFICWPALDVHLGWEQLEQIVNPEAARKALQKSREFNVRYGRAVRKVREQAGLKPSEITGISEKQLRRIESGECRLTSNAIEALSTAHKLAPNEYMNGLAEALD